ncbi:hypothetical protein [Paenibacillus silvestris]|uniref:hypothetical protein n=1 Tax=Paenibacillus silvestris TaxID=2606219 RepID=UPI001372D01A|nr:hypothetical protein [Paenibacillus silvestris]
MANPFSSVSDGAGFYVLVCFGCFGEVMAALEGGWLLWRSDGYFVKELWLKWQLQAQLIGRFPMKTQLQVLIRPYRWTKSNQQTILACFSLIFVDHVGFHPTRRENDPSKSRSHWKSSNEN